MGIFQFNLLQHIIRTQSTLKPPLPLQIFASLTVTMATLAANLSLSDREAIPDALYRSIIGLDSNDKTIFESAWHQDAQFIFDGTPPIEGLAAILDTTFQLIGVGLDTTHMVSNVRIDLKDGADTAKMTAHALAQHYRKGEG